MDIENLIDPFETCCSSFSKLSLRLTILNVRLIQLVVLNCVVSLLVDVDLCTLVYTYVWLYMSTYIGVYWVYDYACTYTCIGLYWVLSIPVIIVMLPVY